MRKLFILALHIALLSILVPPVVVQAETRDAALRQTPATVDELVALLGEHVPSGEDARIFAQQNEEARERRNTEAQTRGLAGLLAPNSSLEQMLLSRRSVGLSDDPALVLGLTADPALRAPGDVQAYGLMLTPAELQELDTRLRAQDHMYMVYEYIKDRMPPEHFGGIWIEGGSTFIGVTAERDLYEDDLRATFPLPDRLQVVLQRQPGVILQRVRLSIRQEMLGETDYIAPAIVSNTVDRKTNQVLLGVDTEVAAVQRFYDSRFGPDFVKVVEEAPEEAVRNTHRTPSRGGLLIGRTAANDETCTTSFIGRQGNARWLMTAGHCAAGVNLPAIFQGQVRINPLERVNVGSVHGNLRADVGIVNLVPALWSSLVFADAGDPAHVIRRNHGRNAVQGGAVQIALGRSNANVLATVTNPDRDITVTSPVYGNYQLIETKRLDRAAIPGDSGSPVFQADIAEGVVVTDGASYVQIVNQLGGAGLPALNVP